MHKLIEYVCEELEELENKVERSGELSMAETQYMDTLAHAKKNLLKGEKMMEEGGYSHGYSMARKRDAMGRYSREPMMPMHSYDHEAKALIDSIHRMMNDLPEDARHDAQKFVKKLESM